MSSSPLSKQGQISQKSIKHLTNNAMSNVITIVNASKRERENIKQLEDAEYRKEQKMRERGESAHDAMQRSFRLGSSFDVDKTKETLSSSPVLENRSREENLSKTFLLKEAEFEKQVALQRAKAEYQLLKAHRMWNQEKQRKIENEEEKLQTIEQKMKTRKKKLKRKSSSIREEMDERQQIAKERREKVEMQKKEREKKSKQEALDREKKIEEKSIQNREFVEAKKRERIVMENKHQQLIKERISEKDKELTEKRNQYLAKMERQTESKKEAEMELKKQTEMKTFLAMARRAASRVQEMEAREKDEERKRAISEKERRTTELLMKKEKHLKSVQNVRQMETTLKHKLEEEVLKMKHHGSYSVDSLVQVRKSLETTKKCPRPSPRSGDMSRKMKRCGLCMHSFPVEQMNRFATNRGIYEQRLKWNVEGLMGTKVKGELPGVMYDPVPVCAFCRQFVVKNI